MGTSRVYAITAAANRAVTPISKSGLYEWFSKTVLLFNIGIKSNELTLKNFCNNACYTEDLINLAEDTFKLYENDTNWTPPNLIYDAANYFTYIDTMQNSKSAKRGNSKEKRNDLRII